MDNNNESIFKRLMTLPPFNGASLNALKEIAGKTKLNFLKYLENETIIRAGETCEYLTLAITGKIKVTIETDDRRFVVSHYLDAPNVIAPEFLFGRTTVFPCTVTAIEPTGILKIAKSDYLHLLKSENVFLLNFINIISRSAQNSVEGILALANGSLEERIAFWIVSLTQPGAYDITLTGGTRSLYTRFGVPRSTLIAALDRMKERNILDYAPGEIKIFDRKSMLSLLSTPVE